MLINWRWSQHNITHDQRATTIWSPRPHQVHTPSQGGTVYRTTLIPILTVQTRRDNADWRYGGGGGGTRGGGAARLGRGEGVESDSGTYTLCRSVHT